MVRSAPHPDALFSLVPLNDLAKGAVKRRDNRHLVSKVLNVVEGESHYDYGLDVGPKITGGKSDSTLATLGRCGCDITLEEECISQNHCQFEFNKATGVVMLLDDSHYGSTQTFGDNAVPLEVGRIPRTVMVMDTINTEFGVGGTNSDLYQFRIVWHKPTPCDLKTLLENRHEIPRFKRTIDDTPTARPSTLATPVAIPDTQEMKVRWNNPSTSRRLGQGSYGVVYEAFNLDTGNKVAVKVVKGLRSRPGMRESLRRETEALERLHHPNIPEYIAGQKSGDDAFEIITELKTGSVHDLIYSKEDPFPKDVGMCNSLLHQLLKAVDYLESKEYLHRDIKPANILYTPLDNGNFLFQLADFGLCKEMATATTNCGSWPYMAPELHTHPDSNQTFKVDIFSIFVTLAEAINAGKFRDQPMPMGNLRQKMAVIQAAASMLPQISQMACVAPEQRPSAGDMLEKIYNGEGRTTPRQYPSKSHIPPADQFGSDVQMSFVESEVKATLRNRLRTTTSAKAGNSRPNRDQKVEKPRRQQSKQPVRDLL